MKRPKLTIALMTSSLILLVCLQVLWLSGTYEKAYMDIQRDANFTWRNVVLAVRDSTFARSIESIPEDSTFEGQHPFAAGTTAMWELSKDDSIRTAQVHILSRSSRIEDSVLINANALKLMAPGFQSKERGSQRKFIIKMMPDTLSKDSIEVLFREELLKRVIKLPFLINHLKRDDAFIQQTRNGFLPLQIRDSPFMRESERPENVSGDSIHTEYVMYNPLNHYRASIGGVRIYLLREITPQILFSIFLTVLTSFSFFMLYRSLYKQHRLMEIKNDFINNVTHELKTPVATVSVALEALKNFNVLDKPGLTKEYLEIAQAEIKRLSQMTEKILSISLEEHKEKKFDPAKTDLNEIVKQALSSMKLLLQNRNAVVRYEHRGTDFTFIGEAVHLINMFCNLLDNALKYSPGNPDIMIILESTTAAHKLSIRDHGIGIAAEYQHRIFEKFFRVPTGDVHNTRGYGLGLSYVAEVVKRHRGTIKVVSTPGKGSEFIVSFPIS